MEEKKKQKKHRPYDIDESKKIFLYVYEHQLRRAKVDWGEAQEKRLTKHSGASMRSHYMNSIKKETALYMEMYPEEVARVFEKVKRMKREERKRLAMDLSRQLTKQGSNISLSRISRMNTTHIGAIGSTALKRMYTHGFSRSLSLHAQDKKGTKRRKIREGPAEEGGDESAGSKRKRTEEEAMDATEESKTGASEPIKKLRTLNNDGVTKQFKNVKIKKGTQRTIENSASEGKSEEGMGSEGPGKIEQRASESTLEEGGVTSEAGGDQPKMSKDAKAEREPKKEGNRSKVKSCDHKIICRSELESVNTMDRSHYMTKRCDNLQTASAKGDEGMIHFSDEGNATNDTTTDSNSNEQRNDMCMNHRQTKEDGAKYPDGPKNPVTSFFGFIFKKLFQ